MTAATDGWTLQDAPRLDGKTAIVTGPTSGIGYQTALGLARLGAETILAGRDEARCEQAGARIRQAVQDAAVRVLRLDLASLASVRAFAAAAGDRVDILVNNAGGTRMGPLESIPTRGWDSIFDLNVRSAYVCTREAGRHMIAQRSGAIVSISSSAGVNGVKGGAHYSAAKSALQMFTRVTAAEWGKYGIRANCVAAGAIASPRVLEAWKVAGLEPDDMGRTIPLRRTGTPDEMANMIVFLASDAASYVTGQTISVDGGPSLGGIPDA